MGRFNDSSLYSPANFNERCNTKKSPESRLSEADVYGVVSATRKHQLNNKSTISASQHTSQTSKPQYPYVSNTCSHNRSVKLVPISHSPATHTCQENNPNNHSTCLPKSQVCDFKISGMGTEVAQNALFTFKPKINAHSVKIAASLESDFMSRQQLVVEKHKKYARQAAYKLESIGKRFASTLRSGKSPHGKDDMVEGPENENAGPHLGQPLVEQLGQDSKVTNGSRSATSPPDSSNMDNTENEEKRPLLSRRSITKISARRRRRSATFPSLSGDDDEDHGAINDPDNLSRSKTMPLQTPGLQRKATNVNLDRVRNAKLTAERAMKQKKIFMIQGPYPAIRQGLRERGWVEKFYRMNSNPTQKKSPRPKKKGPCITGERVATGESDDDNTTDDDDDSDDDPNADDPNDHGCKIPPWEEDNGIYGIMSRVVRNAAPTFIYGVRRDCVNLKTLKNDQLINHYGKAGSFTTKVGLCINMRNLTWFQEEDPDAYFPRCYRLSHEAEKQSFIDDYRLTACISLLKHVKNEFESLQSETKTPADDNDDNEAICTNSECTKSRPNTAGGNRCVHSEQDGTATITPVENTPRKGNGPMKKKKVVYVPQRSIDVALLQCERFLHFAEHDDIDEELDRNFISEPEWEEFIQWYYKLIHEQAIISHVSSRIDQITSMLERIKQKWPQYELDGTHNVWMVKAGAKSRGRGIVPYDRLEEMLKLVSAQVMKEGKYVVQKYIERPLLIYNTKFDIRQWFLVTDWNPLTIYFYKESYLRFCSQEYTLSNFDEAIHLSNNAIQKNYENGPRSKCLPAENMWHCDTFKAYCKKRGYNNIWDDVIYPGMKKAVIGALLCSQDLVEYRKSAFELYGADFMITEDLKPWLIEINSSPSMCRNTKVTSKLCTAVLEDTVKVIIDRKYDKNADIGLFELAYKQSHVTVPPYIGMNLMLEGSSIKKPAWMIPRKSIAPLPSNNKTTDSSISPKHSSTSPRPSITTGASNKASGNNAGGNGTKSVKNNANNKLVTQSYTHTDSAKVSEVGTGPIHHNPSQTVKSSPVPVKPSHKKPKYARTIHRTVSKNDSKNDDLGVKVDGSKVEFTSASAENLTKCAKPETRSRALSATEAVSESNSDSKLSKIGKHTSAPGLSRKTPGRYSESDQENETSGDEHGNSKLVSLSASSKISTIVVPPISSVMNPGERTLIKRETAPKAIVAPVIQNHVEYTEQQKLFEKTSSDKLVLPMKNAETVDIQAMHNDVNSKGYVMTSPLQDSQWGRTCLHCGGGQNLKLDCPNAAPCQCQQDSIRVGMDRQSAPRSASSGRICSPAPLGGSSQVSGTSSGLFTGAVTHPPIRALAQYKSLPTPQLPLPKKIHIDKNKLVSSVYAKAQSYNTQQVKSNRFVLKYTDANIPKPEVLSKDGSKNFPKLVSRYINRRSKDDVPMSIDSYKQNKLTVITQSFQ